MRIRNICCFYFTVLVACMATSSCVQSVESTSRLLDKAKLRLEEIYESRRFNTGSVRARWLKDGSGYMMLEAAPEGGGRELVKYDCATGRRVVLISRSQLLAAGTSKPLSIENYELSPDGSRFLLETNGRKEDDGQGRLADYWILERESGKLYEIVTAVEPGRVKGSFSPDGRRILYRQQENLYACDLNSNRTITLTTDGVADMIENGGGDWGLGGDSAWSPDSKHVAYVQVDYHDVGLRPVVDHIEPTYPKVRYVRYARVGTPLPTLRVGVADVETGLTQWFDLGGEPGNYFISWMRWVEGTGELMVEKRSRGRDCREFLLADVHTGQVTCAYKETDSAWVDASRGENRGLEFIRQGQAFVLLSERDGWRHAYVISRDGSTETLLTPDASDIIERVQTDEPGGWFYYIASPENATQRYLYRVRLDGSGRSERLSPTDKPGTHSYDLSPDGRWAIHTYSTYDTPPVIELVKLPEHRVVRVLEDNHDMRSRIAPLLSQPTEFLQLDIGDGVVMDAMMLKPGNFDPSKKYPVFIYVYSEPHGQVVLDRWGVSQALFHRMIADLGYLVVSFDSRGTPAPKGAAWRRSIFGSLGPISTKEQAAGLKELGRTRPYVDLSRVGIWGWSGGGSNTLNAMFRQPDLYHVGIAVAPKPQPHLYNAWFQEIFMRTLEENPDGYARSAPINFAEGLKGSLLIIHGTGETNTHIQITEGLVDRLIELEKRFDYMAYPNRDHGIRKGKGTTMHLRTLMTRYLVEHLPPGPR